MKIFGIGTDIVKISRIKKSIKNRLLVTRLFNKDEILKCKKLKNSSNCYAKRYAAKEAFSKALGTGIAKGIYFNEIVILNEKNGKPFIKLINRTKKKVENNTNIFENILFEPLKISKGSTEFPSDFDIFFPLSVNILE